MRPGSTTTSGRSTNASPASNPDSAHDDLCLARPLLRPPPLEPAVDENRPGTGPPRLPAQLVISGSARAGSGLARARAVEGWRTNVWPAEACGPFAARRTPGPCWHSGETGAARSGVVAICRGERRFGASAAQIPAVGPDLRNPCRCCHACSSHSSG